MWIDDRSGTYWRNDNGAWETQGSGGYWVRAQPSGPLRQLDSPVDYNPPVITIPTPEGGETVAELPKGILVELQGDSAYEIAIKNGFVGTEQEWLASLQGVPGPGSPFLIVTQTQYDALVAKDPKMLYVVTE